MMYPQAFRQLTRLLPERLVQEPGSLIAYQKRTKHTWRPKRKQHQLAKLLVMNNEKEIKAWINNFLKNGMTINWKATRIKCYIF